MGDQPLRVTHLLKGLGPGGADRLVVTQATSSESPYVTHDVVYLLAHKNHLVGELDTAGIESTCLIAGRTIAPGWLLALRSKLMTDPADILHVHSPALAVAARVMLPTIPRRLRPALVDTEHNRWPRHHRLTRFFNRATIRLNDATIAVSHEVGSTIRGIKTERVHTIVHGIDIEAVRRSSDRASVRAELGISSDEVLIVCVANLRREKALDVLVEAAARAHQVEQSIRFALVGQGPLADEIDHAVDETGLGDSFQILGYRSDATRIISGADLFTLSSRHEGLPVSIMEALALGVPIVATAAGGTAEAVGSAGVIVKVDDIDALTSAWIDLARHPERRRGLSTLASREAERFSVRRAVAEINQIYEEVARAAGDRPSSQS